jgi:hypothetical protein
MGLYEEPPGCFEHRGREAVETLGGVDPEIRGGVERGAGEGVKLAPIQLRQILPDIPNGPGRKIGNTCRKGLREGAILELVSEEVEAVCDIVAHGRRLFWG